MLHRQVITIIRIRRIATALNKGIETRLYTKILIYSICQSLIGRQRIKVKRMQP
jgi:hypothetical protein